MKQVWGLEILISSTQKLVCISVSRTYLRIPNESRVTTRRTRTPFEDSRRQDKYCLIFIGFNCSLAIALYLWRSKAVLKTRHQGTDMVLQDNQISATQHVPNVLIIQLVLTCLPYDIGIAEHLIMFGSTSAEHMSDKQKGQHTYRMRIWGAWCELGVCHASWFRLVLYVFYATHERPTQYKY